MACAIGMTPTCANENHGTTANTALRLGHYFGTTADVWITLQKRFELETARANWTSPMAIIKSSMTRAPDFGVFATKLLKVDQVHTLGA